jgi:hypothetical protein
MSPSKKPVRTLMIVTLLCLIEVGLAHPASAYDAAGDFSLSSNPNGVWSYGWSTNLGSAFQLDTTNTTAWASGPLSGWLDGRTSDFYPLVLHNGTTGVVTSGSTVYQPGQLAEHPGANDQYCIVRWTAPYSGTFSIAATFTGLSAIGDSVDVHILHTGSSIFNSGVYGSPSPASYSGALSVNLGDTIDFAVGFGTDGNYGEDTTALSAMINSIPEPSTLGLVCAGFGCLVWLRFLKGK